MARSAVVAVGGNALLEPGERGTYEEQRSHAVAMAGAVCDLLGSGWRVVVVHGNGPQVGNLAIQQVMGEKSVPPMPLFSLGAMTQGELGSLIAIALYGVCGGRHRVAALLSHVIVDLDDPAFERPEKPIGPFFTEEEAARIATERGWDVAEDAGRGYRRVVPSPMPKGIVEIDAIRSLLDAGHVVVTGGGGGIPVGRRGGVWDGVDAVIDKDHAAAGLADQIGADALVLITGVDAVQLDFGTEMQRSITWMDADEAQRHLDDGQFAAGSMGPKVAAALRFVGAGGVRTAVITTPERVVRTLENTDPSNGGVGTRIVQATSRRGRHA